ncbi:MAG: ribosome biogenesis GTP-binding protein YihA/YsxC [Pseudomonadales bacterium]|nr:YihA family ribosome biogenesis GTP-binding protein [Pseudomonadales bacterium]
MTGGPVSDLPRLDVEFVSSAPDLAGCPPEAGREVAVAGRSNAGKSSVLNRLTGSRHTARVSKTPGRTQLLNFFDVKSGGRLVDLPGYGYAKAQRAAQSVWQAAVNEYLSHRDALIGLVLVMDIRHPLQDFDRELLSWAAASELPVRVLLNKADKLGRGAQSKTLAQVRRALQDLPLVSVQCFSATAGQGVPELLNTLLDWLTEPAETTPYPGGDALND